MHLSPIWHVSELWQLLHRQFELVVGVEVGSKMQVVVGREVEAVVPVRDWCSNLKEEQHLMEVGKMEVLGPLVVERNSNLRRCRVELVVR